MLCIIARCRDQIVRFPIPEHEATVGSSTANEIILPFPGVSRRHARIETYDQTLRLIDLGSKNKLIVNGERMDRVDLGPGVTVQVGRAFLSIEEGPTSEIEVALRTVETSTRRRDGSTAESDSDSSDHAAREAIQLIREIELASSNVVQRERQTFLARAKEILDASSILILSIQERGEVSISAAVGMLPSRRLIDEIRFATVESRNASQQSVKRTSEDVIILWIERRKNITNVFAVAAPDPARAIETWETDFIGFLASRFLEGKTQRLHPEVHRNDRLKVPDQMVLGESKAMQNLISQIEATVSSHMDVLLWGETGTGKELFARMIHDSGPNANGPFVAINCAAIPSELLEAELFGVLGRVATEVDPRPGHFLAANGGSIFLDEIAELTDRLQAKLLRVLQEREVLQLGSSKPRKIDVRVIAATNQNVFELIGTKKFRDDLYYRLRGLQFHIPPLRDRKEDIPPLVLSFMNRSAQENDKVIGGISRKALDLLMSHEWPGNVRELQNEVERAVLICPEGAILQSEHFGAVRWQVETDRTPLHSATGESEDAGAVTQDLGSLSNEDLDLQTRIDTLEREMILEALRRAKGNKSKAARLLGISRNGLAMKLKRLGLN